MPFSDQAIDLLREAIFAYAQVSHGNLAYGIMAVTFLARLALFPLTLRLARSAATHQAAMARIQPELSALRDRFKTDPQRLASETRRLFDREGISMVPLAGCLGGLAQMPVLLALYSAVSQAAQAGGRFFWVRDISRPDVFITLAATALTTIAMMLGPQPAADQKWVLVAVSAIMTAVVLSKMAAGVGLYWGVSSAVGVVQSVVIKRQLARASA
ncbi:MAG: hypothetical protein A3J29_08015 [Acidobacteria bacterium RIFCSPLOWO2_12_FULL_67_14b]|nr:MAG: hypothetical protein A3J29_08015 [Acidobacteria bacterium RIFCSPLOWO2_12_FULL_67_14b]